MDSTPGMRSGWKRSWGEGFDAVAGAYAASRPRYPSRLYDDLRHICGLGRETRVLEVGCGTGQATVDIAPLARSVVALEPGPSLAGVAESKLEDFDTVRVVESRFEDFDCCSGGFDLVVSATAFHWVDPAFGFARAAELLRPGGWLALWWNVYHDPEGSDPFGEHVSSLIEAVTGNDSDSGTEYGLLTNEREADFAASGAFGAVHKRRYRWKGEHSAEEIRMLFSTYSNVLAMSEADRNLVLDGLQEIAATTFGGRVTRPYVTALYVARKTGDTR